MKRNFSRFDRKGQGLSMNVIIIAILGVLVLVVMAVIFTGQAGIFSRTTQKSCIAQGGLCVTDTEYDEIGCGTSGTSYIDKGAGNPDFFCKDQVKVCCVKKELLDV